MAQPERKTSGGHFDRFRALVDAGWLAALSKNELAMWMAYEKCADRDGIAYPDGNALATVIGHASDKNVWRLRRSLVSRGLLEVLDPGRGRGKRMVVRVLIPAGQPDKKNPSDVEGFSKAVKPLKPEHKTPQIEEENPSNQGAKTPQTWRAYKEEQPINYPVTTQSNTPAAAPRSGTRVTAEVAGAQKGKPTTLQARAMADVWEPKWSAAHYGASYSPARVDFVKLAEILSRLRGRDGDEARTIDRFGKIADTALAQPEEYGWQGHKLTVVEKNLPWLISETARREKGIAHERTNGKPKTADRTIREELTL